MAQPEMNRYRDAVHRNYLLLKRSIDPTDTLFDELDGCCETFVSEKIKLIRNNKPTTEEKVCGLLNLFMSSTNDATFDFLTSLRNNNQEHVVNVITEASDGKRPLTDEKYELLHRNVFKLYNWINPVDDLLTHLLSRLVFSDHDVERVKQKKCLRDMAEVLVKIIMRKSECSYDKFLTALVDSKQEHVVHVLTDGSRGLPPIPDEMAKALIKAKSTIVNAIEPNASGLLDELVSIGVFVPSEKDYLTTNYTDPNKLNGIIIDLILRKPKQLYDDFMMVLNKTGHQHVSLKINGCLVTAEVVPEKSPDRDAQLSVPRQVEDDVANSIDLGAIGARNAINVPDMIRNCIKLRFSGLTREQVDKLEQLIISGELKEQLLEKCHPVLNMHNYSSILLRVEPGEFERARENLQKYALMTPDHHMAILSNIDKLVQEVVVSDELLNALQALDTRRRLAVKDKAFNEERVRTLLEIVSRLPDPSFQQLIDALITTGQQTAADILLKRENDRKQDTELLYDWHRGNRGGGRGNLGTQTASSGFGSRTSLDGAGRKKTKRMPNDYGESINDDDWDSDAARYPKDQNRAEIGRLIEEHRARIDDDRDNYRFQLREMSDALKTAMNSVMDSNKVSSKLIDSHESSQRDWQKTFEAHLATQQTMKDSLLLNFQKMLEQQTRQTEEIVCVPIIRAIETMKTTVDNLVSELKTTNRDNDEMRREILTLQQRNATLNELINGIFFANQPFNLRRDSKRIE